MAILQKFMLSIVLLFCLRVSHAAEYAGVKVDDSYGLAGSQLSLNGAGIRYKAIFKVYVAALYVGKKTTSPEEVLAQPGPKRIHMTMLRNIDANELGRLFSKGMQDNMSKPEFSKLITSIVRMGQMFSETRSLKTGDTFSIDWIPNLGTVITIKGKPYGEPFKEPELYNALLRIWIGQSPADWKLKDSLLGTPG